MSKEQVIQDQGNIKVLLAQYMKKNRLIGNIEENKEREELMDCQRIFLESFAEEFERVVNL